MASTLQLPPPLGGPGGAPPSPSPASPARSATFGHESIDTLDELLVGGHILDVGAAISPEQQTKSTGTVGNRQVPTNPKNKTGISHAFLQSFNHGGCSSWEKKREKEERISPQSRGHYWISFSHTHVLTLLQKEKKRRKRKENH